LLAPYAGVPVIGAIPSIEPMCTTRAGSPGTAAARSSGTNPIVK
jgi:hypothetical protein